MTASPAAAPLLCRSAGAEREQDAERQEEYSRNPRSRAFMATVARSSESIGDNATIFWNNVSALRMSACVGRSLAASAGSGSR